MTHVHVERQRALERIQRRHELDRALEAARTLHCRLELLLDHPDDAAWARGLRDRLADALGRLG